MRLNRLRLTARHGPSQASDAAGPATAGSAAQPATPSARDNRRPNGTRPPRFWLWWCEVITVGVIFVLVVVLSPDNLAYAATSLWWAAVGSVEQVLTNLRAWLMGILAGLATLFLTIGAVRYVMANGDPGEIEKAKTAFRGSAVGYALAVLAPLVVSVLQGIIGG